MGTVPTALTLLSAIPVASTSPSASTRPVASTAAAHALSTAEARVLAASLREPFLKLAQFRVPIELTLPRHTKEGPKPGVLVYAWGKGARFHYRFVNKAGVTILDSRSLSRLTLEVAFSAVAACAERSPPVSNGPPPPPPVVCFEYPSGRYVSITCRYFTEAQWSEVWQRSIVQGSRIAVAMGFTHIQWLSGDKRVEAVPESSPVECRGVFMAGVKCEGGEIYARPVALLATTQFAFLTAEEARARTSDPLVPRDRFPLDARHYAQAADGR